MLLIVCCEDWGGLGKCVLPLFGMVAWELLKIQDVNIFGIIS